MRREEGGDEAHEAAAEEERAHEQEFMGAGGSSYAWAAGEELRAGGRRREGAQTPLPRQCRHRLLCCGHLPRCHVHRGRVRRLSQCRGYASPRR